METSTRLSVNLNKVALIRNARGANYPDLLKIAADCEHFGAEGITVHPRPDERHVRFNDLQPLKDMVQTEFNIEGYPTEHFIKEVIKVKPHQCTLVPDAPDALTSDSGWDTVKHESFLTEVVSELKSNGIRVSIFLNPEFTMLEGAGKVQTDRIELYTGPYAASYPQNRTETINEHRLIAEKALEMGIGLNAGHDLNLKNLAYYKSQIPGLLEVSIGHALICDSLYFGLKNTIQMYLMQLKGITS